MHRRNFLASSLGMFAAGTTRTGLGSIFEEPMVRIRSHGDLVLSSFSNCSGKKDLCRSHLSADGLALGSGQVTYEGCSRVLSMAYYKGHWYAGADNCGGNKNCFRIHRSKDLLTIMDGTIVYEGCSPPYVMLVHGDSLLVAFSNCAGNSDRFEVRRISSTDENPGAGKICYAGTSPVLAMCSFDEHVYAAFGNCNGNLNCYRVHRTADLNKVGYEGIVYEGTSPPLCMLATEDGVLTGFARCAGKHDCHRIHLSQDGKALGAGKVVYEGISYPLAMSRYGHDYLTYFGNIDNNPEIFRIHRDSVLMGLGSGKIVYEGRSPLTCLAIVSGAEYETETRSSACVANGIAASGVDSQCVNAAITAIGSCITAAIACDSPVGGLICRATALNCIGSVGNAIEQCSDRDSSDHAGQNSSSDSTSSGRSCPDILANTK